MNMIIYFRHFVTYCSRAYVKSHTKMSPVVKNIEIEFWPPKVTLGTYFSPAIPCKILCRFLVIPSLQIQYHSSATLHMSNCCPLITCCCKTSRNMTVWQCIYDIILALLILCKLPINLCRRFQLLLEPVAIWDWQIWLTNLQTNRNISLVALFLL